MGVRKLKPITPGQRFRIAPTFEELTKSTPEKSLLSNAKRSGGRNSEGRMTTRNIGGGHKKRYRVIDFKREKTVPAIVHSIEYDPNRTARIALLFYKDGEKRYIIAPENLEVGTELVAGPGVAPEIGNALPIGEIPMGTIIHNIEIKPGRGAAMVRSAGAYAQLVAKDGKYVTIKLPSGEMRMILAVCTATIGSISNSDHMITRLGKAGRNRWLGRRPRTRGVAMNPVDHPMGGGEGKSSGGHPRSRNGIPAKGFKTRSKKKYSDRFIVSRSKK